jgi:hypothetical protein
VARNADCETQGKPKKPLNPQTVDHDHKFGDDRQGGRENDDAQPLKL